MPFWQRLFSETRRRHVFKVAAAYGVVAWVTIQIAATTFPILGLPDWATRLVLGLVLAGFPVSLVLAWAFELTPEGVRRAAPAAPERTGHSTRVDDTRRAGWIGVGIVLGLASVGAYGWVEMGGGPAGADPIRAIAVLPFANASRDSADEYFADGISEEVLTNLSKLSDLRVISRTSVLQYRDAAKPLRQIGQELDVSAILEGSVRRDGNRARIQVRLVDARSDESLWTAIYDRRLDDVLDVQSEVALQVVRALRVQLSSSERGRIAAHQTADPEAYDLYLKGRFLWNQRTEGSLRSAIEHFQRAIERDPGYAAAHAGLASVYVVLPFFSSVSAADAYPAAKRAAVRALELDRSLGTAHAALGAIYTDYEWDFARAEREFRHAVELEPNDATSRQWYGELLTKVGRHEDAISQLNLARRLDPVSLMVNAQLGYVLYSARRYDAAIAQLKSALELDRDFGSSHLFLGQAYLQQQQYDLAEQSLLRALESGWMSDRAAILGYLYARRGQQARALSVLARLEEHARRNGVGSADLAVVYMGLGKTTLALDWLETAARQRESWMVFLRADPMFDPLRSEPRFEALVRKVGLD